MIVFWGRLTLTLHQGPGLRTCGKELLLYFGDEVMEIAPRYSAPKMRQNTCQEGVSSNQEVKASLEKHVHLQYQCRFTYLRHVPFLPHKSLGCLPKFQKNPWTTGASSIRDFYASSMLGEKSPKKEHFCSFETCDCRSKKSFNARILFQ